MITKQKTKHIGKKTILVIEDDLPLLEVIHARLTKKGFHVISARSVDEAFYANVGKDGLGVVTIRTMEQALEYLEKLEHIDAIWLDHHLLGDEDGLDFVKKFKANGGQWSKIPVFVVSNAASPATVKSYVHSGVTKYYVKSDHRLDEIISDIESHLQRPSK